MLHSQTANGTLKTNCPKSSIVIKILNSWKAWIGSINHKILLGLRVNQPNTIRNIFKKTFATQLLDENKT